MSLSRRRAALATLVVATVLVAGCAPKTARTTDPPQAQVLVVLLPDADTGKVGRVVVSNTAGQTELSKAYTGTRVTSTRRPPPLRTLRESDVKQQFGDIIATVPPAPLHFTLFFEFDSESLTAESRAIVQDVMKTVKAQPVPDVVVIGHTDTTGTTESNFELGMRRATTVRNMLIDAGLSVGAIDTRSHGELELLVPTANGVFEPKNRRVEITVR
jgi:outer membrane protein OmpA-like peptidoglycan-associated protein